jgi:UDP-N-acetylmuramate dehydrogenase
MAWQDSLPPVRGKLLRDEPLGPFTWFRVGGAADVLFIPADEEDLGAFLKALDPAVPVQVLGVGSNVIVRDGGVDGVVVRLAGRTFAEIVKDGDKPSLVVGAGALDSMVAKASAKAGIAGLEFFAGIPGTIGGALTMNAGCYGSETKDVLYAAWGFDRAGNKHTYGVEAFDYTYRHSRFGDGEMFWMQAVFDGTPDDPAAIAVRIAEITSRRELTQPIREKTGGSTFKNPPGHSSWKLVDEAGWRGKLFKATGGGAMFSELHSNFMINPGEATAADIEGLGEAVRADVLAKTGVQLDWEIKRIGRPG